MRQFAADLLKTAKRFLFFAFFLFLSAAAFAQTKVSGKVTGPDSKPVFGATVAVKGTNIATTTLTDGSYSVTMPHNSNTLVFSYVGFEVSEVNVRNQNTIDVVMKLQSTSLNEVVVTGYATQRKKDISGAVATVNVTDAKKVPVTSSEQLLQGQAAGVTVINSGAPGAASTVFVRGISNFGHTAPLYVIDGVQVSDMSTVNPNDIESISVLKDAGAAAIYGISGGNGVIVVTTKRGRAGKTVISYDGYYGIQEPIGGNPYHIMNPEQQSELAFRAGDALAQKLYPGGPGKIPTYGYHTDIPGAYGGFGAAGVTSDNGILQYYHYDASHPANDYLIQKLSAQGTNWWQEVFRKAPQQSHTLTASGGNGQNTYLFSINYLDQIGTLVQNYEKRYQVRLNTSFTAKDHFRFGENIYATYRMNNGGYNGSQQQEGGSIAYTFREMPIVPVYDVSGKYFGGTYDGPTGEPMGNGSNPFAILARQANNRARFVLVQGNVFAEADFLKHFTARTAFGANLYNQYYYNFTYNQYADYEQHTSPNGDLEDDQISSTYNWTNTVTYKQIFGKHNVQALVGYEMKAFQGREVQASAQNFFSMDPNYVQLQFGTPVNAPLSYIYQPTSTQSYFGRVDYVYNDKYILGATIRRDGYSIFYPGHQWGTFPSVSLAWRMSEEDFMKGITWINNLKLRASYGEAGNNGNITGNNAYTSYASGTGTSYYGIAGQINSITQGFYQNQNGNPKVTWETDKITNVGIDGTIFNHVDLIVDWYKKAISGLLFTLPLPATAGGANAPVVNVGDVQNTGVDLTATYRGKISRDFNFNIGTNITTYKSLVTSIPKPGYFDFGGVRATNSSTSVVRNQQGHPIGEFFGYQTIGIYQSDADAQKGATYAGAKAGSFIYKDVNGDGKIDGNDRTFIGNPNPKFTYGLNLGATYKNFDFTMILYGSAGNKDFNYVKYWTDFYATFPGGKNVDLYNKAAIVQNGVVTNPGATLPAASFNQDLGSSAYSSFYVEDGSFLKCRVMQLGYTFDPKLIRKTGMDKLHVYVQATNLFTITKYSGPDPELVPSLSVNGSGVNQSAAFGIDYGAYPNNQRQFIFGVNLSF